MPNIKSAKKRVKVTVAKANQNKVMKTQLRTEIKKTNAAIETGENAVEAMKVAVKKIDQAVSKGILHKNTAARKKSSLAKKLNASA